MPSAVRGGARRRHEVTRRSDRRSHLAPVKTKSFTRAHTGISTALSHVRRKHLAHWRRVGKLVAIPPPGKPERPVDPDGAALVSGGVFASAWVRGAPR